MPRDFPETAGDRLRHIIERETGITISADKQALLKARLGRRLRALGLQSLEEYADHLNHPNNRAEIAHLISAITTNHTAYWREPHHFGILRDDYTAEKTTRYGPYRIWSAGCSTGQEPYTAAMTLDSAGPVTHGYYIWATDIDHIAIETAKTGLVSERAAETIPPAARRSYLQKVTDGYQLPATLRKHITFDVLNLHGKWPENGDFNAIFCRNVMIYFDREAQHRLWQRLITRLRPNGLLFIGHSESLPADLRAGLEVVNSTTFRKPSNKIFQESK